MDPFNYLNTTQSKLLGHRIIDIRDEVNESMANYVRSAFSILSADGSPDLTVHITSDGGEAYAGFGIYDLLRSYEGKTKAKVFGYASSAASIILQGCQRRLCARNAHILIHHPLASRISYDVLRNKKRHAELMKEMEDLTGRLYAIYKSRSGMPYAQIRKLCRKDNSVSAKEALKLKLVDELF